MSVWFRCTVGRFVRSEPLRQGRWHERALHQLHPDSSTFSQPCPQHTQIVRASHHVNRVTIPEFIFLGRQRVTHILPSRALDKRGRWEGMSLYAARFAGGHSDMHPDFGPLLVGGPRRITCLCAARSDHFLLGDGAPWRARCTVTDVFVCTWRTFEFALIRRLPQPCASRVLRPTGSQRHVLGVETSADECMGGGVIDARLSSRLSAAACTGRRLGGLALR